MIVNMSANATEEQIQHVMDRIKECGFLPHLIQGAERTVIGVVGKNRGRRAEVEALRVAPGVDDILVISQPYTLVSLELQPAAHRCRREGREDRRAGPGGDCRAVFGRVARAADGNRARGEGGRRPPASRRRVQAAHLALRFSGPGSGGTEDPGGSAQGNRACR